jgi:hypothetical protein
METVICFANGPICRGIPVCHGPLSAARAYQVAEYSEWLANQTREDDIAAGGELGILREDTGSTANSSADLNSTDDNLDGPIIPELQWGRGRMKLDAPSAIRNSFK